MLVATGSGHRPLRRVRARLRGARVRAAAAPAARSSTRRARSARTSASSAASRSSSSTCSRRPPIAFAIGSYINQVVPGVPVIAVAVVGVHRVHGRQHLGREAVASAFELVLTVHRGDRAVRVRRRRAAALLVGDVLADALPHGWGGAFAALPFAIWFYLAIEGIANVAEEARNPQRDLPRGFLLRDGARSSCSPRSRCSARSARRAGTRSCTRPSGSRRRDSPLPLAIGHVVSRDSPLFVVLTGIGLVGLVASFHGILIAGEPRDPRARPRRLRAGALGEVHPRTQHAGRRAAREHRRRLRRAADRQDRRHHPDRRVRRARRCTSCRRRR